MNHELERIERYARHVLSDAVSVSNAVRQLSGRPDFETNAVDTIKTARSQLEHSLSILEGALEEYNAKQVTA